MGTARLAAFLVFMVFLAIPFLGGNHLPLSFVTIDRFWIEGVFGMLLIIATALQHLANGKSTPNICRFYWFFLPFFCITAISLIYSWNQFNTLVSVSTLVWSLGAVYLYTLCTKKDICITGLVAGAVLLSVAAMIQHKMLFPSLTNVFTQGYYAHLLREQSGVPFASYLYHNMLGGYLAFVVPLSLYYATYKRSVISLLASGVIVTGVVLTSTRIGLGIVLLVLFATMTMLIFERDKWGTIRILCVVVLASLLSLAMISGGQKQKDFGVQYAITQKAKTAYTHLSTINTRTDIWKNAVNAFRNKPWIGYGAGSFEYGYRKYFDGNSYTAVAHSTPMKVAVELGILGLLSFCFYLYGVYRHSKKRLGDQLNSFVMLAVVAGTLFGLIDFSFDVASHVITFFVLTSTFFLADGSIDQASKGRNQRKKLAVFSIVITFLLFAFVFVVRVNIFKASLENGDLQAQDGFLMNALTSYREAIEAMPLSSEGYVKAMSVLMSMYGTEQNRKMRGVMTAELDECLQATEGRKDRNSELYLTIGKVYALKGNAERADIYFDKALYYYPSSGYYIHEIAGYYAASGRLDAALSCIRQFDPYIPKYKGPYNPRGIFVYRIRDLEADVQAKKGNRVGALQITRQNLEDAMNNRYVITSTKSRSFTSREEFLTYLRQKVFLYQIGRISDSRAEN
ncbi:MAG: O-Antigen ligase [Syntrophorhabdus sp. PtaU1.Bin153]|nr:MAG: O-Antigen ligase [Syntrophorhabdus sp. PtaU1.Bin153]